MPPRVLLYSATLALANLGSVWIGFLAFYVTPGEHQIHVQIPVAVFVSVVAFSVWIRLARVLASDRLRLRTAREWVAVYALAPVWAAVVFVPLHYAAEGYLTAFSNVLVLWAFQLIANVLVVAVAAQVGGGRWKPDGRAQNRETDGWPGV